MPARGSSPEWSWQTADAVVIYFAEPCIETVPRCRRGDSVAPSAVPLTSRPLSVPRFETARDGGRATASPTASALAGLAHRCDPARQLSRRHILLMSRYVPAVAERILDSAHAVTVELVLDGADQLPPRGDGLLHRGVHIRDIQDQTHRRAAVRARPARTHVAVLVGKHDDRVADIDLGMAHPAAWSR